MSQTFFEVESLSFSYNGIQIFDNLSFRSERSRVVFKGPSGCGKTTLLKLLSGNLSGGSWKVMPPAPGSCLLIQEDGLFPWLTGVENIVRITGISSDKVTEHAMYPLVEPFIHKKTFEMSFGQRRLAEVFRAIVYASKYLYIDEPFNFLDLHRIEMLVPFFRRDFLKDTILVVSSHHRDEDLDVDASIFRFEGDFPVRQLTQER